jgi:hypothetical protein
MFATRSIHVLLALYVGLLLMPRATDAQTLGTFGWHFHPYCNVVTFTVEQRGGAYLLTGSDNQCGNGAPSPALGTAVLEPGGTVGLGFSVVSPSARISNIKATVTLASFSGVWQDQDGNSGTFVFNPGGVAGAPRPAPRVQITSGQIGLGAVTPETLAPSVFAGSGLAPTAARSDHLHDDRYHTRPQAEATFAAQTAFGPRGIFAQANVNANGTIAAQRMSTGAAITVVKGGPGVYSVRFPGLGAGGAFDQMISITPDFVATGSGWRSCAVNLRSLSNTTGLFSVTVQCYNNTFAAADSAFYITVTG